MPEKKKIQVLKEQLKKRAVNDIEGVVIELETIVKPTFPIYDNIILLKGRIDDMNSLEKNPDLINHSSKEDRLGLAKNKKLDILEFYLMNKNRLRMTCLNIINELKKNDLK